jgi:hypothetical protein
MPPSSDLLVCQFANARPLAVAVSVLNGVTIPVSVSVTAHAVVPVAGGVEVVVDLGLAVVTLELAGVLLPLVGAVVDVNCGSHSQSQSSNTAERSGLPH